MLFIMLATLLLVVQIFGNLNCLLMRSVCLDPTLSPSLSFCICGATRLATFGIGFVSGPELPVGTFSCACVCACVFGQIRFHLPVAFFTLFAN